METIPKKTCAKIGYLHKPHGINGGLVLNFEEDFEESIAEARLFFIEIDGLLVPFFPEKDTINIRSAKSAFVKFDWITDEKKAKELAGNSVYLKLEDIIQIEETFKTHSLIGFTVEDANNLKIGIITEINDYSGNIVLTIESWADEILVPYNENLTIQLDKKNKLIQIEIPEGLIDAQKE